ncbi:MAG: tetratricopeptide repeat protein [Acidobacteriia bacterium]|nr:tetratricopeptide repeat protein [Terriglobia bacterium]
MAVRTTTSPPSIDTERVQRQLARILASKTFRQVDRLQRFLTVIVNEALAGRGDNLKEFLIGIEVFDKESTFDPRMDPIVRVQARRLRARLARYYREEGRGDDILVELPKGGYAPVFQHVEGAEPKHSVASVLTSRNTIAVCPFEDDSGQGDLGFFCRGITEEILHTLAEARKLRVVRLDLDDTDHVDSSHVAMKVTGSVRKSRETLRITTHLVDAATGCFLWSVSVDRNPDDLFAVQEEVARSVLEKLQAELGGVRARAAGRPTENLAAYNLYLQGRHRLNQRTEEGMRRAVEFFEKAAAEDPQYAQTYAGLADAYGLLGHYGVLSPAEVWTKAASNAAWSVLLDDDSAEAHTSLAHVKATQDWDWHGAEREFQRAISLDPRHATSHHWYAMSCLAPLGRLDDALQEILMAHAIDPISSIIARDLALTYYYRREFELSLEQCDRTIEQNPHFSAAYWALGLIQQQLGDFEESAAAFERALQLSPHTPRMRAALGRTLALSGKHNEARHILSELLDLSKKRYVSPFEFASMHFALGERDEGFEWLAKAYQDRCFELIVIKVDPRFDALRNDPRFTRLAAQLGIT